jgi:hypothetical protein
MGPDWSQRIPEAADEYDLYLDDIYQYRSTGDTIKTLGVFALG